MEITVSDIKKVSSPGLKFELTLRGADLKDVDGSQFIRLVPWHCSLVNFVFENNPHTPIPRPKTLSGSRGLADLTKLRNEAQAAELKGSPSNACTLFTHDEGSNKRAKMETKTHAVKKQERQQSTPLTFDLTMGDENVQVTSLRPVQANDAFWILYDATNVANVMKYIRDAGFDEVKHQLKAAVVDLPKGVWKKQVRGHTKYVATWSEDGVKKFRFKDTLAEAVATTSSYAVGHDDGDEHNAEPEAASGYAAD
jgi:hypothetical protein